MVVLREPNQGVSRRRNANEGYAKAKKSQREEAEYYSWWVVASCDILTKHFQHERLMDGFIVVLAHHQVVSLAPK